MKQYVYRAAEIGRRDWSPGIARLDGIEETSNPNEADLFVCPGALHDFTTPESLDAFPFMRGNESRHIFFSCADDEVLYRKPCLFIRCNANDRLLAADPNTIAWPWPSENFSDCVELPADGFRFDISFQGWLSSDARILSVDSCRRSDMLCDIAAYPDFTGARHIYDAPEGLRRRAEFRRSMRESRIALCPQSLPGHFPYRFFEAMSAGRIPCLVGTGQMFPWADQIPYSEFCLFVSDDHASNSAIRIDDFIRCTSDNEIVRMGRVARQYFLRYLDRDKWTALMTEAILLKITQLQNRG